MLTDFIRPQDPRWRMALERLSHDIYDLPEYVALCGRWEQASALAFYARDGDNQCLIPLLLDALPGGLHGADGWLDARSPYGYSSALFSGGPDWCAAASERFVQACRERRILSVFLRLHPLIESPLRHSAGGAWRVVHGRTVVVDLAPPDEVLQGDIRDGHLCDLRRLRREGFRPVVDDWSQYAGFIAIYHETMRRLRANNYYHFPQGYFHDLRAALGSRLHLISVLAPDGRLAAAGLFPETGGIVQYHLSGTAERHARSAASKLMLSAAITWAKQAGARILHLGGGLGGREDGLFRFKAGFSRLRRPFETWRFISDSQKYADLSSAGAETDCPASGFFPAYRRPA